MSSCMRWSAARPICVRPWLQDRKLPLTCIRSIHVDGRARLSNEWVLSGGVAAGEDEDAHSKLIRAGFIRQSHSGIFHLLPLGLRVQDKLTRLVDRYMRGLGACRVQLSAISSESLWEQSGRLDKIGSELFRFTDRKEGRFLLGPTHEEEITTLVARSVQSYKSLPLRLYQITQKYRDELRPRHGLLRGRDFLMKDLYTFDCSVEQALKTYEDVRKAYSQIFIKEMKLPILVAKASSGDMGGDLSHEYHIPTSLGEDHVISCNKCDYIANEEVAQTRITKATHVDSISAWRGISKDRKTLVNVWYDSSAGSTQKDINTRAVKQAFPELDTGVENAESLWAEALKLKSNNRKVKMVNLFDCRLPENDLHDIMASSSPDFFPGDSFKYKHNVVFTKIKRAPSNADFLHAKGGEGCPQCPDGTITVQKAIELGHTFHLGTRYSKPMKAVVTGPKQLLLEPSVKSSGYPPRENTAVPLQMGCHGIGISRIIGAVANHLVDQRGLNWPRVIAPYEVVIIVNNSRDDGALSAGEAVYDVLAGPSDAVVDESTGHRSRLDAIIDDRNGHQMGWKLKDADLVGYPVVVIMGREWKASARVEVQCRRLGFTELRTVSDLRQCVEDLLQQL